MRKLIFLFILMLTVGVATKAADVTFKASAPQAVVMGRAVSLDFHRQCRRQGFESAGDARL